MSNNLPIDKRVKAKVDFIDWLKAHPSEQQSSESRLPRGQKLTTGFPVLDLGKQPEIDFTTWHLEITGIPTPLSLSLEQLKALGVEHYTKDFHCVTTWSKFDVLWTGVPFQQILKKANPKPTWKFLLQYGLDGYSTNVPREDMERPDVFIAFELDGKPIPREHGSIRLIIPHLYAWKGAKFLSKIEFSDTDKPGFWEVRGYHRRGNAQLEERYG